MLENRSPRKIYFAILAAGVTLGMTLGQAMFVSTGIVHYRDTTISISALMSIFLVGVGWRMIHSLPWTIINDPARYEYRNPNAALRTAEDGVAEDSNAEPPRG